MSVGCRNREWVGYRSNKGSHRLKLPLLRDTSVDGPCLCTHIIVITL